MENATGLAHSDARNVLKEAFKGSCSQAFGGKGRDSLGSFRLLQEHDREGRFYLEGDGVRRVQPADFTAFSTFMEQPKAAAAQPSAALPTRVRQRAIQSLAAAVRAIATAITDLRVDTPLTRSQLRALHRRVHRLQQLVALVTLRSRMPRIVAPRSLRNLRSCRRRCHLPSSARAAA